MRSAAATVLCSVLARAWVAPPRAPRARAVAPRMGFWDEFDAVVDDFLNKRLGGGEIYYGARESKFYGEEDRTRSKQEFGKYQGKGYSDSRRIAEKLGRDEGPKWVGDQLKEGSYLDGTGKAQRQANRFANLFDKKKE